MQNSLPKYHNTTFEVLTDDDSGNPRFMPDDGFHGNGFSLKEWVNRGKWSNIESMQKRLQLVSNAISFALMLDRIYQANGSGITDARVLDNYTPVREECFGTREIYFVFKFSNNGNTVRLKLKDEGDF